MPRDSPPPIGWIASLHQNQESLLWNLERTWGFSAVVWFRPWLWKTQKPSSNTRTPDLLMVGLGHHGRSFGWEACHNVPGWQPPVCRAKMGRGSQGGKKYWARNCCTPKDLSHYHWKLGIKSKKSSSGELGIQTIRPHILVALDLPDGGGDTFLIWTGHS